MIAARLIFLPWPTRAQRLPARRELRLASINRDRSALLVYSEHGERRALRLTLPSWFGLRYHGDGPLPKDSNPVALTRTALHRPPCRETRAQAEVIQSADPFALLMRVGGPVPQAWERVSHAVMYLHGTKKEDRQLARRLAAYQELRRQEYEARLREIEDLPADEAVEARKYLPDVFKTYHASRRPGEKEFISVFDVTLADVQAGALGLRNEHLQEQWAKQFHFGLGTVKHDAETFRSWIKRVAYTHIDVNRTTGKRHGRVVDLTPDQWEVLEASVRYELRFANGARVWLDGVEETATLMPQEAEDFEKLKGKPTADLAALQRTVRQTHKLVEEARAKARAKSRKWHQAGGKATSKWKGHETEAAELARYMRQVRDAWLKEHGKRGALQQAFEKGRAWWKHKFKGEALENFLAGLSDSNLYRVMQRDWRTRRTTQR